MLILFQVIVLILSIVIHEYMHGWAADYLGDNTPRLAGRLSFNPLAHLDLWGSFVIPVSLLVIGGPVFGWAKPVPYNPNNLRDKKFGGAKVALAGPAANLILALLFSIVLRLKFIPGQDFRFMLSFIIFINILLAIFNLLPIPPLDGSKILAPFLSLKARIKYFQIERFGLLPVILFIYLGFPIIIYPIVNFLFYLFTNTRLL